MTLSQIFTDLNFMLPELALIMTLCAVVLFDAMTRDKVISARWSAVLSVAGLSLALLMVLLTYGNRYHSVFITYMTGDSAGNALTGPISAFSGLLVVDKLSDFFKVLFYVGSLATVFFSIGNPELKPYRQGEYYTLLLATVLGGSFLVSSNNYLMLVLSLETLSLCSYVLVGYLKHNRNSAEASLKYILYGSVASGVMLFGISYIYGMAGTLDIRQSVFNIAMRESDPMAVLLAFALVMGGLGFKVAAAPFHFWAPDVYQGAPTPITAFLSVVSKAAGFSALFRVSLPLFTIEGPVVPESLQAARGALQALVADGHLTSLFWILSAASMTVGNLVALRQTDLKRLLAYSSIAHAGYILMGMTTFSNESLEAMLFYLVMYAFTNLGAFGVVIVMINRTGSASLDSYRGMISRSPMLAILMILFLISLTGIPPTAGFIGKMWLFKAVANAGAAAQVGAAMTTGAWFYFSLLIIAAVNTGVSAYYYLKIIKTMVFDAAKEEAPLKIGFFNWTALSFYGASTIVLFLLAAHVYDLALLFER